MSPRRIPLSVVVFLACAVPSYAYIDPGTGMSFVSGIGAFLAGMLAMVIGTIAVTYRRCLAAIKAAFEFLKRRFGGRPTA